MAAAKQQHTGLAGQTTAGGPVAKLAADVLRLHTAIEETEALLEAQFGKHEHAEILLSLPGFGPLRGTEFIAATGGTVTRYESADRLAGIAGVAPTPAE